MVDWGCVVSLRDLRHWWSRATERGYRGPRHAAILRESGAIERVDLAKANQWRFNFGGIRDVAMLVPASGAWMTHGRVEAATPERAFAVAARLDRWRAWRERWLAAHPEVRLEEVLRRRDWYSHMSDDGAVWAAGEREDAQLRDLCAQVPADTVRALWARYAPPECCTVPGSVSAEPRETPCECPAACEKHGSGAWAGGAS